MKYFSGEFRFSPKPNRVIVLRFNPIQIAEWLEQLLSARGHNFETQHHTLAETIGIAKHRVTQYLALLKFPADLQRRIRKADWIAEGHLRPLTNLQPGQQRIAIKRLLQRAA
jgi:hypothetical protein